MRPESVRTFIVTALVSLVLAAPTAVPSHAATAAEHRGHERRGAAERMTGHQADNRTGHREHARSKQRAKKGHQHQAKNGHKHKHQGHQRRHKHKHRNHKARPSMTIGTYNLRAGMGMRKFRNGVRSLRRHVGVAGLQEIGSNRRRHHLTSIKGWGYFRPKKIQQNPVIWNRDRFRLVRAEGHRIAKSRHLRGQLPGAKKRKKDSTATVVRLRHRPTGRKISVINVHLVHGAVKGGKPWPHRPAVFNLFRDQVRGLVRTVRKERRWGRPFVVGDFNVGYRADKHFALPKLPYRQLSRLRLNSMWQGTRYLRHDRGTHSDALIDQIWSKRKPQHVRIMRWVRPSDHFPAIATYRLRKAKYRR